MLNKFYSLYFECFVDNESEEKADYSRFNLGVYSTGERAKNRINDYKGLPGFRDFPIECFKVKTVKVNVQFAEKKDGSYILYELSHEYYCQKEDRDYDSYFGLFSTKEHCEKKIHKLIKKRKYRDYPENFYIDKITVDKCQEWLEGFYIA